jgi:hypothetical protein
VFDQVDEIVGVFCIFGSPISLAERKQVAKSAQDVRPFLFPLIPLRIMRQRFLDAQNIELASKNAISLRDKLLQPAIVV